MHEFAPQVQIQAVFAPLAVTKGVEPSEHKFVTGAVFEEAPPAAVPQRTAEVVQIYSIGSPGTGQVPRARPEQQSADATGLFQPGGNGPIQMLKPALAGPLWEVDRSPATRQAGTGQVQVY